VAIDSPWDRSRKYKSFGFLQSFFMVGSGPSGIRITFAIVLFGICRRGVRGQWRDHRRMPDGRFVLCSLRWSLRSPRLLWCRISSAFQMCCYLSHPQVTNPRTKTLFGDICLPSSKLLPGYDQVTFIKSPNLPRKIGAECQQTKPKLPLCRLQLLG
jgi:hypothetical protein